LIVGRRISEQKAANLLGLSLEVLRRWESHGITLYRICNNKRTYYLEDIINFQITRGLLPHSVLVKLSSSPMTGHNRKGCGPGKKQ